jgi:hypothetical protein
MSKESLNGETIGDIPVEEISAYAKRMGCSWEFAIRQLYKDRARALITRGVTFGNIEHLGKALSIILELI